MDGHGAIAVRTTMVPMVTLPFVHVAADTCRKASNYQGPIETESMNVARVCWHDGHLTCTFFRAPTLFTHLRNAYSKTHCERSVLEARVPD